jgi:hypothetical protein
VVSLNITGSLSLVLTAILPISSASLSLGFKGPWKDGNLTA